jgi:ribulose kinase
VDGIVRELANFTKQGGVRFGAVKRVAVTGSAPRKNSLFTEAVKRRFKRESIMPGLDGAGFGAAIIGAIAAGVIKDRESAGIIGQFQGYARDAF